MTTPDQGAIVSLDLPEHGRLDLPLAGLGARSVAALIDIALLCAAGLAAASVLLGAIEAGHVEAGVAIGASVALGTLMPVIVPLAFELGWRGRTPGKRLLHLRVISEDGSPAAPWQLLIRNILRLVDFMPLGYILGLASMFVAARTQRLGDMAAGTIVIREDPRALAEALALVPPPARSLELHGIPDTLLSAAALLLEPGRELDPEMRARRVVEVARLVRRYRPDVEAESDAQIWARLGRELGR
jgi:uncharacterized RDD family membrane protein YckC